MRPSDGVRDAFVGYIEKGLAAGDAAAIAGMFSREPGVAAIGTDPIEWWSGHDAVVAGLRAIFESVGGGLPVQPGSPVAYEEGDAGWSFDRPVITVPSGVAPDFRLSAVFRREGGDWKIVLVHGSLSQTVDPRSEYQTPPS